MGNSGEKNRGKISGIYVAISFIPWVIYWVLCGVGVGNVLGIVIPLAVSLLLIIPQIRKRDFSLMDLAAVLYFSVASVGTFVFSSNIFVKSSGLLGYSVLFLMALFSLVVKQPFTLQGSKRDYPETFSKHEWLLAINNLITVVWACVFLSNAIIFLLLSMPLTLILSNILLAIGVILSMVLPLKAAPYFVSREFKKYDWSVKVNSQEPKGENEYDVIVVGSGIGGLTCGALLSKRGYKVLVLEQHYQVGGYCSSFKRKGFTFNAGVIDVSGLWERGPITYFLREIGLKKEDFFVRNTTRYTFGGREIRIPDNLDDTIKMLSEFFTDEKENIREFFEDVRRAYEECYGEAEIYGTPLPEYLVAKVSGGRRLADFPKDHPHFYGWVNKTFREKLDEFFINEDLKSFLGGLAAYTGTKPEKTPALTALTVWMGYFIHGGHFTKGGAQNFVDAIGDFIKGHGGKVLTKHRVDRIVVEHDVVKGVRVGDTTFNAPIVVANANAKAAFLELVGEDNLNREFVDYIKGLKMSPSCFVAYLGVDMDLSDYPTLIKNLDENFEVAIISNSDRGLAPKGKSSVLILADASYYDFPKRGTIEYEDRKRQFTETVIKKAEKVIPDLSRHVEVLDAATPRTMERYTSMYEGALYSFDQSIGTKRPYFKTPIRHLYLAGASTFPSGGIEASMISGMICANDICNWEVKVS